MTPDSTASPGSTASTDPFTLARTAPDAPEEIRSPASVASCGHLVLSVAVGLPRDATECLERTIGTERAELAVARFTTEGDPVVTFYLTYPDLAGYDVVVDQRQDSFSNGGFARYRCAGEPVRVLCRFLSSPRGWRHAEEDRSRGQGAGCAAGA